jgi:hypothetical protein
MQAQNIKYLLVSFVIVVAATLIGGELIARTFGATLVYEYDAQLGWRPKQSFSAELPAWDLGGEKYLVSFTTNASGFRAFGNLDSGKKRVLFIGDSWTGDPNTSDQDAYFGIVAQELPLEVFAIGGGGYGTLQELMLLRKFAAQIKPDIFVLQYCDNDLINNSYFLEGPSITRNQKNLRPYWVEGKIKYRLAPDSIYRILHRNSRLFRSLDALLSTVQYKIYGDYFPPAYEGYSGFKPAKSSEQQARISALRTDAEKTTLELLTEMKRVLPATTRLVTFAASSDDPKELNTWLSLAAQAGFSAYPSVSMRVEQAEAAGQIVRVRDGAHWNRLGNRIAGKELARRLAQDLVSEGF